jgi:hypothetical protein
MLPYCQKIVQIFVASSLMELTAQNFTASAIIILAKGLKEIRRMSRMRIVLAVSMICIVGPAFADKPFRANRPEAYVGTVVGNGHCIKFVQVAAAAPLTAEWRPGAWVRGNRAIAPGTAIATFETDGTYTSKTGNHAAIYISQDATGIWVYDQWRGQSVHKRLIRFEGGSGARRGNKSNDANLFRVIELRQAGEMVADSAVD